jgi:aminoglycoside phosphotransferase (APT) family kinase protein
MTQVIAFAGHRRLAEGSLADVTATARQAQAKDASLCVLAFDTISSRPVDLDLRSDLSPLTFTPPAEAEIPTRGRGRPKLGVEAREVTLLPRHWEWLNGQRAGASATLRRLVEDARRADAAAGKMREGKESLYRFITAMAGDMAGYEEAVRALFANDGARFEIESAAWPADIRTHALGLLPAALGLTPSPLDSAIPKDRLAEVRRVLDTALPGREVEEAERMTMGLSGAGVFKVVARGTPYLLRLDNPTGPYSDPKRQYACQAAAAAAGVAPALLYADGEAKISLSRFVETTPPPARDGMLRALGAAVRRLHDTPLFAESLPYFDAMDMILGMIGQSGMLPQTVFSAGEAGYRRVKAGYPAPDLVSTHNDLNPGNVLFVGEAVLFVDWETGSRADRFVDIAAVTNWFADDEDEALALVTASLGHAPDGQETARAYLMRQVNRLFYGAMLLMAAMRRGQGKPVTEAELASIPLFTAIRHEMPSLATAEGQRRLGCAFFKEGVAGMADPAFDAALTAFA